MSPHAPPAGRLRDLMTVPSQLKYLAWRASGSSAPLAARLRSGERLHLRPPPAEDLEVAYEIFAARAYDSPRPLGPAPVRRIVDLGANVGMASLYLLRRHLEATSEAFEPHPAHFALLRENLARNGLIARATLHEAAVGASDGEAHLFPAELSTRVVAGGAGGTLPVRVVDVFRALASRPEPIDLLKMDIEGGEYALLADERFAALRPRAMVIECHDTPDHPDGRAWCERRLGELGFEAIATDVGPLNTVFWCYPKR